MTKPLARQLTDRDDLTHEGDGRNVTLTKAPTSLPASETAAYISDMLLELRSLAKNANLKFLTYLLEMAFEEAFMRSQKKG